MRDELHLIFVDLSLFLVVEFILFMVLYVVDLDSHAFCYTYKICSKNIEIFFIKINTNINVE